MLIPMPNARFNTRGYQQDRARVLEGFQPSSFLAGMCKSACFLGLGVCAYMWTLTGTHVHAQFQSALQSNSFINNHLKPKIQVLQIWRLFFQLKVKFPFLQSLIIFTSIKTYLRQLRGGNQEVMSKGHVRYTANRRSSLNWLGTITRAGPYSSLLLLFFHMLLPLCHPPPVPLPLLLFFNCHQKDEVQKVTYTMLDILGEKSTTQIITNHNLQLYSILNFVPSMFIEHFQKKFLKAITIP